jgi:hypothetical protein
MKSRVRSAAILLLMSVVGCSASDDAATEARAKAACYPPCLGGIIAACPMVGRCTQGPEPDATVARTGESAGVAICYASGDRSRTTSTGTSSVVYVEASDGTPCYTVTSTAAAPNAYTVTVAGQVVATVTDSFDTDRTATVTCGGMTAQVDESDIVCSYLPWQAHGCGASTTCTFGSNTSP